MIPRTTSRRRRAPSSRSLIAAIILVLTLAGCSPGGSAPPTVSPSPTTRPTTAAAGAPAAGGTAVPSPVGGGTPAARPGGATPSPFAISPGLLAAPDGTQRKIDSILLDLAAIYQREGPQAAERAARDAGVLNKNDEVRLTLVLTDTNRAPLEDRIKALGGRIVGSADNLIDLVFPLSALGAAAQNPNAAQELANFATVKEVRATPRLRDQATTGASAGELARLRAELQPIVSEGVKDSGADRWHGAGLTGRGVKVGIVDSGFTGYQELLGRELPAKVTARAFNSDNDLELSVHGTACAEIVHAMAPDAELYLVAVEGPATYTNAFSYLIAEGVKIISLSQGRGGETRGDGSGPFARAVDEARAKGVLVVVAAGNDGDAHHAGTFADSDSNNFHEFAPGKEGLKVGVGRVLDVVLRWDAWEGAPMNLDLFVFTADGQNLVASSRNVQGEGTGKEPVEAIFIPLREQFQGQGYLLLVRAAGPARPVKVEVFTKNSELELVTPVTSLASPGDAKGAFTIGATNFADDKLEDYSAQGPTVDGRQKPDLLAPARVRTAAYTKANPRNPIFPGTSAATPHAAGAAALVLAAQPDAGADTLQQYLLARARDLGKPGSDNESGAGLLQLGPPASWAAPSPTASARATPPPPTPTAEATVAPTAASVGRLTLVTAPPAGPAGTSFQITGQGFEPGDSLIVAILGPAGQVIVRGEVDADVNGQFGAGYDSTGDDPGSYTVVVGYSSGTLLATSTFTVSGAGVPVPATTPTLAPPAQPTPTPRPTATPTPRPTPPPTPAPEAGTARLGVAPPEGLVGTEFEFGGLGFPPDAELNVLVIEEATSKVIARGTVDSTADGSIQGTYDSTGDPPGTYLIGIFDAEGTALAAVRYTVR